MNESRLQTLFTVLPVISAALYFMGITYHQSYLAVFGLDDSQFPLASDKSLVSGFLALMIFSFKPMLYAIIAVCTLVFTVIVTAILSSYPKVKHWQSVILARLASLKLKNRPSEAMHNLVDKSTIIYGYSVGIFLLVLSLVFATVLSGKIGKEQAVKEIGLFNDKLGAYAMLHTKLLPTPIRVKQIICSPTHCAFWLGNETLVIRHDSVERTLMYNPAIQAMQKEN